MIDKEVDINNLIALLKQHMAQSYELSNVMLRKSDEYTQSLYFRMLCAVTLASDDNNDEQQLYLRRVLAGIESKAELDEYMADALHMFESDIEDFVETLKDSDLRYTFCVDALILISAAQNNEHAYEIAACLFELLSIKNDELRFLSVFAAGVLTRSNKKITQAEKLRPMSMRNIELKFYIYAFRVGPIVSDKNEPHYLSLNNDASQIDTSEVITKQQVSFKNMKLELGANENLRFRGNYTVEFIDCEIKGSNIPITFKKVTNVIFTGCRISGFTKRFSVLDNCHLLKFEKCNVSDCGITAESLSESCGGVFRAGEIGFCYINDCTFANCYVKGAYNWRPQCSGTIFFARTAFKLSTERNVFNNCKADNNYDTKQELFDVNKVRYFISNGNIIDGKANPVT